MRNHLQTLIHLLKMVEFKKVKSKFIIYILLILVSLPLEVIVLPYYIG